MDNFFKLVYDLVGQIVYNLVDWIVAIVMGFVHLFFTGWMDYGEVFSSYFRDFGILGKFFAIILALILVAIPVAIVYLIIKRIRLKRQLKKDNGDNATLYKEIGKLNKQVLDLIDEKNRIMAMKLNEMGATEQLPYMGAAGLMEGSGAAAGGGSIGAGTDGPIEIKVNNDELKDTGAVRFPKLALVDERYANYVQPVFNETITLEEFAENYRKFAAGNLGLYYSPEIVRRFIAGMAASRILILEGISGTGKTSLPYSFSRYLDNPATIVSVQPSFRDRTELIGYFNEFSKRFVETEFLRALYEANYREDANFIVLDELNLARVEYYFAEMLSVLEMPSSDEWNIDIVPTEWEKDPAKLVEGKLHVEDNTWFVGTANNDDSTFTITDKVYDRAIPIEINERSAAFECEKMEPCYISVDHLKILFDRARMEHPVSEGCMDKLNALDKYLQKHFKLSFGNRITKQMNDFIPVYIACGGTEEGGIDYIVARKVLKKFESMNIMFVREELNGLILYIEKLFGRGTLKDSISYLTRIRDIY